MPSRILVGDNRASLRRLPEKSVHAAISSPPYYALRDYEVPPVVYGGMVGEGGLTQIQCEHTWGETEPPPPQRFGDDSTLSAKQASNRGAAANVRGGPAQKQGASSNQAGRSTVEKRQQAGFKTGNLCSKCGAWSGQLGNEPTPELFIEHLIEIFEEVRRVLRDDGVCWVVLGDSYAGSGKGRNKDGKHYAKCGDKQKTNRGTMSGSLLKTAIGQDPRGYLPSGLKELDLIGIPWMFAFAARRAGWYLRCDVVWSKPNAMTESIFGWRWERHRLRRDDPKDDGAGEDGQEEGQANGGGKQAGHGPRHAGFNERYRSTKPEDLWEDCPGCKECLAHPRQLVLRKASWRPAKEHEYVFQLAKAPGYFCDGFAVREDATGELPWGGNKSEQKAEDLRAQGKHGASSMRKARSREEKLLNYREKRNRRSVWEICPEQFKGAHFATFPTALVQPCLLASVPERACYACGTGWAPVYDWRTKEPTGELHPSCSCNVEHTWVESDSWGTHTCCSRCGQLKGIAGSCCWVPGVALDPFGGSGTVAVEAYRQNRDAILCELNRDYAQLAYDRIRGEANLFAEITIEETP